MKNEHLTPAQKQRYSRHLALPGFNEATQQRILEAHVLVVGVGGLGSPALLYLAAAGVGIIGLADDDIVNTSNLQRQILFNEGDVEQQKTHAAQRKLQLLNGDATIQRHDVRLSKDNALEILHDYDIVLDCTDNFASRYLLNDTCVLLQKPLVYGAIFRDEGQVSVFNYKRGVNYRDLFPHPPPISTIPNCEEAGVMGTLAGIIGSMQAQEALKIITGLGEILDGQLLIYEASDNRMTKINILRRMENPLNKASTEKISLKNLAEIFIEKNTTKTTKSMVKEITAEALKKMSESGEPFQLIDVREQQEFDEQHLNGHLIPMGTVPERFEEINREGTVVIHCKAGSRSAQVIEYLQQQHGYTNLLNLKGGILEWNRVNGR